MEAPEDLSKVEWGAGLAKLIESEYPNLIFFIVGFSLLALPSYLFSGIHEHELSHGSDTVFPIVLSIVLLFFAALMFLRLRAALLARGSVRPTIRTSDVGVMAMNAPMIQNMSRSSEPSWQRALGLGLTSVGTLWLVEAAALWSSTLGVVGFGWAAGLTTFCAYPKPDPAPPIQPSLVYWQECYEFSRAWGGTYRTPSHLPPVYFSLLLAALLFSVLGPALWFVLWKIIRQAVRPARVQMRTDDGLRELPQTAMFALAVSVGIIAGGGAWVFRQMIGLVHNVFFFQASLSKLPFYYDANQHTPPPAPGVPLPLIIISPVIGGLIVAFLVQNWAPEAKGHGVPEVMDAIHYKRGRIRPSVAGVKILASSFSIGSGGSVGREGPIIQIGSTFGSIVGVASGCSISQRVTLIACGAAGGIAATFNTPIGGIVFAVELMLPAANSRTLMPLGIASVVATYIGRFALGLHPAFDIPTLQETARDVESVLALLSFLPFGIVIGLVAVLFVKGIYWAEDMFDYMPGNYYSRHAIGMLGQGLLMYLMMLYTGPTSTAAYTGPLGHYWVQGVGYASVRDVLSWVEPTEHGNGTLPNATFTGGVDPQQQGTDYHIGISNPTFCILLFLAKALSTGMTIGSGASGGIFSPSLYLGATIGGAWGHVVYAALDFLKPLGMANATPFDPVQACVAGMAGMVGGSTGASITAITMTFEMTRDYKTILPIVITTVMAHMTRKAISEDSIYTLKLVRRGHVVPEGLQAAMVAAQRVRDVMTPNFRILGPGERMSKFNGVTLVAARGSELAGRSHSGSVGSIEPLVAADGIENGGGNGNGHGPNGDLTAVCGPVLFDHETVFGRVVKANEYAVASGELGQALCVVSPSDDLHESMRRMIGLDASAILVVSRPGEHGSSGSLSGMAGGAHGVSCSEVVGVVTKSDIARNMAQKTEIMSRDRTLFSAERRLLSDVS